MDDIRVALALARKERRVGGVQDGKRSQKEGSRVSDRRTKKNTDLIKVKYALPAMWVIILDLCINPFPGARCLSTWISPPHGAVNPPKIHPFLSSRIRRVSACVQRHSTSRHNRKEPGERERERERETRIGKRRFPVDRDDWDF